MTAAAIANPGMSSWVALVERAKLAAKETVLVNGATGVRPLGRADRQALGGQKGHRHGP